MEDFDPSPRASKRRRTGTYATRRTTLDTLDSIIPAGQSSDKDTPADKESKTAGNGVDHAEAGFAEQAIDTPETGETISRRSSTRRRKPSARVADAEQDVTPIAAQKLKRKDMNTGKGGAGRGSTKLASKEGATREGQDDQDDAEPQPRSSGRTRKVPRRFSPDVHPRSHGQVGKEPAQKTAEKIKLREPTGEDLASAAQAPRPKGILTPSRHGREKSSGPRKSVVFDANELQIEEKLGFKDIDNSSNLKDTKKSRRAPKSAVPNQSEISTRHKNVAAGGEPLLDDIDDDSDEPDLEIAPNVDEILSLTTNTTTCVNGDRQSPIYEQEDEHITKIKVEILGRMTNRTISPISHLRSQYSTLHSLLSATIAAGESNSLLLLGSRGSGKSLLISHALSDLTRSYGDDFHVVRLNGFFQTDDKVALREIWRQLGREMAVSEDETGEISSYADTMASLLSLLSHPEELPEPDANAMLLDTPEKRAAKSVIFIMDEFDLFTTHPRQTLLYNLFDIAQAKKAPIAVIGCSTRMDVVDCLEKRVKSRFSHRWLHVPCAKTLPAFEETIASILLMPVDVKEALGVGKNELEWSEKWNGAVKVRLQLLSFEG